MGFFEGVIGINLMAVCSLLVVAFQNHVLCVT